MQQNYEHPGDPNTQQIQIRDGDPVNLKIDPYHRNRWKMLASGQEIQHKMSFHRGNGFTIVFTDGTNDFTYTNETLHQHVTVIQEGFDVNKLAKLKDVSNESQLLNKPSEESMQQFACKAIDMNEMNLAQIDCVQPQMIMGDPYLVKLANKVKTKKIKMEFDIEIPDEYSLNGLYSFMELTDEEKEQIQKILYQKLERSNLNDMKNQLQVSHNTNKNEEQDVPDNGTITE